MAGTTEFRVLTTVTATSAVPPAFTECHQHGSETCVSRTICSIALLIHGRFCLNPSGEDIEVVLSTDENEDEPTPEPAGEHCHFHAGVECVQLQSCIWTRLADLFEDIAQEAEHRARVLAPVDELNASTISHCGLDCSLSSCSLARLVRAEWKGCQLTTSDSLSGVFGPIVLTSYLSPKMNIILLLLRQFGTGVIISTVFVHVSNSYL
jgi:solute carrier family 39 (zinc transporter), member 1/2/3